MEKTLKMDDKTKTSVVMLNVRQVETLCRSYFSVVSQITIADGADFYKLTPVT